MAVLHCAGQTDQYLPDKKLWQPLSDVLVLAHHIAECFLVAELRHHERRIVTMVPFVRIIQLNSIVMLQLCLYTDLAPSILRVECFSR